MFHILAARMVGLAQAGRASTRTWRILTLATTPRPYRSHSRRQAASPSVSSTMRGLRASNASNTRAGPSGAPSLFPIAQRRRRDADAASELGLRQSRAPPDRRHIDDRRNMNLQSRDLFATSMGARLGEAVHQPFEIFRFHRTPWNSILSRSEIPMNGDIIAKRCIDQSTAEDLEYSIVRFRHILGFVRSNSNLFLVRHELSNFAKLYSSYLDVFLRI